MAGCAVGVLLTGLSRISPKIQGKKQGKNCRGAGTCLWQCAGPQFPAGLLFLYGMFLCGTGLRSAGRAGLSMVSFPALPAVALQGEPVRHMSIRSSATGIPASVRMKPGVAQFPRPGPEQVPVPARMSGQALVSNNIRGAPLIRETGKPDAGHGIHARLPRRRHTVLPRQ